MVPDLKSYEGLCFIYPLIAINMPGPGFRFRKNNHPRENIQHRDLRTTVYWEPELVTDKDGNTSFEYYNADGPGTYRVIAEGIDERGRIGRQLYRYKVE